MCMCCHYMSIQEYGYFIQANDTFFKYMAQYDGNGTVYDYLNVYSCI